MSLHDAVLEEVRNYGFKPEHDVDQIDYLHDVRHRVKKGVLALPKIA